MEKSTVLLLSKLQTESGNFCTASRLKLYIEAAGFRCILADPNLLHIKNFKDFLRDNDVGTVFGLHAYYAGKLLTDVPSDISYVIILGGTDINEFYRDNEKMKTMTQAIRDARFIVGFSKTMIDQAKCLWKFADWNCFLEIPQAVVTNPSEFSLHAYLETSGHLLPHGNSLDIFLLVGGIRPVKDPLFLVEAFSEWHCMQPTSVFVIVGPCLEENYCQEFLNKIQNLKGIVYIPGLNPADTQACIKASFALVNSSLSEGMSAAILEAMQLCVPVIARDIPGNSTLIKDNMNGLLFETPQEFICKAEMLLRNSDFLSELVSHARVSICERHNMEQEKQSYVQILNELHCGHTHPTGSYNGGSLVLDNPQNVGKSL